MKPSARTRESACARKSLESELARLHLMSVEDKVKEALSMTRKFSWLKSVGKGVKTCKTLN